MRIVHVSPAPKLPTPTGWSPEKLISTQSSFGRGFVRAGLDVMRGSRETSIGQRLTGTQQALIAPYLMHHFKDLPATTVRNDLANTSIVLGGFAAGNTGNAVTVGRTIYVKDTDALKRMTSWEGRRWLVHELAHVMQWRQISMRAGNESATSRRYLAAYLGGIAVTPQGPKPGAAFVGTWHWIRSGFKGSVVDSIHDSHWMEKQAEEVAVKFRGET